MPGSNATLAPSLILGWPINHDEFTKKSQILSPVLHKRSARSVSHAIQYSSDRHLITFAPTGSGKGVSVIIPNLLHYSGPAIVIDPKGENFAVTARYRQETLGQTILLLDPFHAVADECLAAIGVERQRLNPLDLCYLSTTSPEMDAQMLADLFAGDVQSLDSPFWDNSAKRLISGLFAHEMQVAQRDGRPPRLSNVINRLFADDPIYSMAVMLDKEKPSPFVTMSIGAGLLAIAAKETRDSILSTAHSYFSLFTSSELVQYLDTSTIRLQDIQQHDNYTLYIVIPPTKLHSHSTLLKMWICVLMHSIMERRSQPERRTLFILDECANLGKMEILRQAVTLLRGYGLQVWMFFQDLDQLEMLYPDSGTMINNCGVLQAFGLGRLSAAAPLVKILGSVSTNDLLQMDDRQQVLSVVPGRPTIARLARYYKDEAFIKRFDPNPLVKTPRPKKRSAVVSLHRTDTTL